MFETSMLIGQSFVAGTETPERVVNPKTEEVLYDLPEASVQQVDGAVTAAEKAFKTWAVTTPAERSALLLKLADAIERESEAFAALEALNCGKPRLRVLQDEMPAIVDCFRFFAGAVRAMHGAVAGEYLAGHTSMVRRDPIGVVGSIAPWNYPLMMAAWKLAPALAGGNTVVLKPSEQTPLTALKLARLVGRFPSRRRQRGRRSGGDRRQRHHQSPKSRDGLPDRRHRDGEESARRRRQDRQAHASRAWRRRRSSCSSTPISLP